MSRGIYLDNSMAARPSITTVSKMMPFYTDHWGHPSSPHQMGAELYPAMAESYKALYTMIGAKEQSQLLFTSSGTESVNQVILSTFLDVTRTTGKNQFITAASEEAPILMSISRLEQMGAVGKMVKANAHGRITPEAISEAITPRTALVSLSWADGMTGVIHPVEEIAEVCRERGVPLHLDATHILGKLFYDLSDVGASFISFNGEQLHGPAGTGGLWIKEGVKCSPFLVGGIEQGGRRAGSFNIPGLIGLGNAARELIDSRDLLCTEVARLRNTLEHGIASGFPDAQIFFTDSQRLPHCTAVGFPGVANEALLFALNRKGVFACIGGGSFQQIGLVLEGAGIAPLQAHTAVSFSLSRETTDGDVERAVEIIVDEAKKLRKLSKGIVA